MIQNIVSSLNIPANAMVDKRIPKKTFVDNATLTSVDKKLILEAVDEMHWVAALKPSNIAVPAFKDEFREYLEIAIISVSTKSDFKNLKLNQTIHRAIPYPVFLITASPKDYGISLAHKRWAQGSTEKIVIEDFRRSTVDFEVNETGFNQFLQSLDLSQLSQRNLFEMYQSWMLRLIALDVSCLTGIFKLFPADVRDKKKDELENYERLCSELRQLRSQAGKEKQINRRVDLNLKIKQKQSLLETSMASLIDEKRESGR